jgi:transposase
MQINTTKNMKNAHLAKSDRNGQMIKQLAAGRTQSQVAKEFNITAQRVNGLVQKWLWRGLLEKTGDGFAIPQKGRLPAKVIHNQ